MKENQFREKEFSFTIETLEDSQGESTYQTIVVHQNIPLEVVITRMQAFLKKLEQMYHDTSENSTTFVTS